MSLEKMMEELRIEYLNSIPSKITEIQSHLDANARELLHNDFHKLKGSGRTYGIPEITQLGESVEKLCLLTHIEPKKYVPSAINILETILAERRNNKAVDLLLHPEFMSILALHK